MTLNKYAYDLFELLRANLTDNEPEDIRQIEFWIATQRAYWLSNKMSSDYKVLSVENEFLQLLDNISVSNTNVDYRIGEDFGSNIKVTEELPEFITGKNGIALQGVYPQSIMGDKIVYVPWERFLKTGNQRYNGGVIYASFSDGKIFFTQKVKTDAYKLLDKVVIRGAFNNPEDLSDYTNTDGNSAYSESDKYPISLKWFNDIKKSIIENNFKLVLDGRDSQTETSAI